MELAYEYTRKRKMFGKHPNFTDMDPKPIVSVKATTEHETQWIERAVTTTEIDCIPQMSEHSVNTERFIQEHKGMHHTEGGWPKEINTKEFQDKQRYLRRVENEPSFQTVVSGLALVAEKAVKQNNTIDLYEEYFEGITDDHAAEPPSAQTVTVFHDPSPIKRSATQISWVPEDSTKLAVSYSVLQFQKMPEDMPISSYIWDVNNPNHPHCEIIPQSPLCCLVFNPKSSDHLVGGSYNGLVGFWDVRKGSQPVENSVIEHSHHDPVYDVSWIQSRTGNECCSISTDGQILWWDIRKLGSGPTDSMTLQNGDDPVIYGGTSLEYRSDAGATRFLVGTEQGTIMSVERKAAKDKPSQKSVRALYGVDSGGHHGPIYSIHRNPTNLKYLLTIGDWTARVWMEDLKTPIMTTHYEHSYLTAGCWSPTRPGVFFTTKLDGSLDIWDLYYRQSEPVYPMRIGEVGLSSISVESSGKLVAVGALDGTTTLLKLNTSLSEPQATEKQAMQQMFERETKREKNLEVRALQLKREQDKAKREKPKAKPNDDGAEAKAREEKQKLQDEVEKRFFEALEKEKEKLKSQSVKVDDLPPLEKDDLPPLEKITRDADKCVVKLLRGLNVKDSDGLSGSDVFVKMIIGDESVESERKKNTSEPVWNQEFLFENVKERHITFELYDYDKIGEVRSSLDDIARESEHLIEFENGQTLTVSCELIQEDPGSVDEKNENAG